MRLLDILATARRDVTGILEESLDRHGPAAFMRYEKLIKAAFEELRRDPSPVGSRAANKGDLRLIPFAFLRDGCPRPSGCGRRRM